MAADLVALWHNGRITVDRGQKEVSGAGYARSVAAERPHARVERAPQRRAVQSAFRHEDPGVTQPQKSRPRTVKYLRAHSDSERDDPLPLLGRTAFFIIAVASVYMEAAVRNPGMQRSLIDGMRFRVNLLERFPTGTAGLHRFERAEELFWHIMPQS
jgi:hypothetical protein